jgi:hypothetical protein
MGLGSREEYEARAGEHPKYIVKPEEYFKDWWVAWYHFLGVDTSGFPSTKADWIRICKERGIKTWEEYKKRLTSDMPANPREMYEDYISWDKEMGVEDEIVW